jgi:hypothetical protein
VHQDESHAGRVDQEAPGPLAAVEVDRESRRQDAKQEKGTDAERTWDEEQHCSYGLRTPEHESVPIVLSDRHDGLGTAHQEHQPQHEVEDDEGSANSFPRFHLPPPERQLM